MSEQEESTMETAELGEVAIKVEDSASIIVGRTAVEAIRSDTFLLLTHPEVRDTLVRRAEDPEAFLDEQVAAAARDE